MKTPFLSVLVFVFVASQVAFCSPKKAGVLHPQHLRCEYLDNPLGIDVVRPRLSWYSTSNQRDENQTAYTILVASSLKKLNADQGNLWDSGRIKSSRSLNIIYNGKNLHSGEYCFWKVRVWDSRGNESEWSKPAEWSMGLLNKDDWQGYWIGLDRGTGRGNEDMDYGKLDPPPNYGFKGVHNIPDSEYTHLSARYLRKEFNAPKKVKRATVYICGLGYFELYFNGKKISDDVLSPALSEYNKRSFYMTFDVTKDIREGKNAIGVILGNARFFAPRYNYPTRTLSFGYPRMLFHLNIEYTNGTRESIVSDTTWKITAKGPIVSNNEYDGEIYDSRREMPGWDKVGFNASKWMQAEKVSDPSEHLSAQMVQPNRVMQDMKPISMKEIKPGVYIYDMGQNMVGWVSLKVHAKRAGTKIMLRFAETLLPNGELNTANLRSAKQTDVYMTSGRGLEEWQPEFIYHGFQYVELTGYPGRPDLNTITGKVVYDNIRTIGHFTCSNNIINKIHKAAYWGIRGNYHGIPTDCPQRDERQGWEGDRSTNSFGESFIFDNDALYSNWMTDIEDCQKPDGSLPDLSPDYWPVYTDNMTWPSTFLIVPDHLYQQFDNVKVIADHYSAMKKWLYYMQDKYSKGYLLPKDTYGDWCMPPRDRERIHSRDSARVTPGDFIGSAYYYYCLNLMDKYARLLDKDSDAQKFSSIANKVRQAINEKFLNKDSLYYANNTVTANSMALSFGIPPKENRSRAFDNLVYKTVHVYDDHTSCGLVGEQWFLTTLTDNGRPDIALKVAENTTYPSWGYMIDHGATTIWELWDGNTANPAMNSRNHVMLLGDFVVWLYQDLAGIKSDPSEPGYKHIIMKPYPEASLKFVEASYLSPYGLIISQWKRGGKLFNWDISVPANTTATIYIPAEKSSSVKEGGKLASHTKGVKFIGMEDGRAVYYVVSGRYRFASMIGK